MGPAAIYAHRGLAALSCEAGMKKNRSKNLTETETKAVGELIGGLKKLYGKNLSKVILYGSKARGDSRKDSDIDVMVVLRDMTMSLKEIKKINEISVPISLKYNLFISELPVKESKLRPVNRTLFMENALNESLNLYER